MPYSPLGRSTSASPTFSWPATSGAISYIFYLSEFGNSQYVTLTSAQVDPLNTGICSFTPTAAMTGVGNGPFAIPLTVGHTAAWWIEGYNGASMLSNSGELTFYVPTAVVSTTDFGASYIDTFDPVPVTKWYYVSDFIGQCHRSIDFAMGPGTSGLGTQVFHENLWCPINISDLIPPAASGATIAIMSMEVISSATRGDMMGWTTKRHGSAILNIPNVPLRYVVSPGDLRASEEITVLLKDAQFDFLWSHVVNGIDYASVNGSTCSRTLNASIIALGVP